MTAEWQRSLAVRLAAVLVVLGCFIGLASHHYCGWVRPAAARREGAGPLMPPVEALNREALSSIHSGIRMLNDTTLPAERRVGRYVEHLREAERLLLLGVRTQPAQAESLARLAAVRWELDPPTTHGEQARLMELIELASRMAPGVARVQMQLGEVVLRMGQLDEALALLGNAITMNPGSAREVAQLLAEHYVPVRSMLERLPDLPETLAALEIPFSAAGEQQAYVEALEAGMERHPDSAILLRAYGSACLRLRAPRRLVERLDGLDSDLRADVEAERLLQRARGLLALGLGSEAIADAAAAAELQPGQRYFAEQLGSIAMRANTPGLAVTAFRRALALAARQSASASARALLYRRIGQALDLEGNSHLAYDAYRKALALDPEEAVAARRVKEMRRAVGGPPVSR